MIARGDEEEWRWHSFGSRIAEDPTAKVPYATQHEIPRAGIKQGGKVSMLECCKIAFHVEPWAINTAALGGFEQRYIRFTIQAAQFVPFVPVVAPFTQGAYNLDQILAQPNVYWVHQQYATKATTSTLFEEFGPHMYDVSAPNGQGILFKGKVLWTTYMCHLDQNPMGDGLACYSFRCLCRTVWVDPAYYAQATLEAHNAGGLKVL